MIDIWPSAGFRRTEIAAAHPPIGFSSLSARRQRAVLGERRRRLEETPPRHHDHEVAGREVLETMVDDRAHALGHGLVLLVDTFDTSEGARLLRLAVDQVVVPTVLHALIAAEPIGRVRQQITDLGLCARAGL